jgi:SpoVK/Ycf46/Vps4 family AAA+-type ATPase
MAASNLPWDLDVAVLRRYASSLLLLPYSRPLHIHTTACCKIVFRLIYLTFSLLSYPVVSCGMEYRLEKRVMVPLPCAEAREQMVRKNLADRASADLNYEEVQTGRSARHVEDV